LGDAVGAAPAQLPIVFVRKLGNKDRFGQMAVGPVIPDHYQILGVTPGADDAVVRASYRALMRLYHPDRNADPRAQARVREITAAFAVLGDPGKRAAYDAERFSLTQEELWFAPEGRSPPPPPMRRLGIASIVVALAMTLAFAMHPRWSVGPASQRSREVAANSKSQPALPAGLIAEPKSVAPQVAEVPEEPPPAFQPVPSPSPAPAPIRIAAVDEPDSPPLPPPARHLSPPKLPQAPVPLPALPQQQVANAIPEPAPAPAQSCRQGWSRGADGKCSNDRVAQVEGIATGFLKQSMAHADWHKQQLLLSASNRSATSRMLCHSAECVTGAYLREMRDITTIMQGHIPNP